MTSANTSEHSGINEKLNTSKSIEEEVELAAELILHCDAILFTSGAGMGVGSGLGTFRGIGAGVWPPLLQHPELDFTDMSNPSWFTKPQGNSNKHDTANFGYAFWAYRYDSYTSATPHQGYQIAQEWSRLSHIKWAFNFTSNIDAHWIKSGWKETAVYECHGSIDYMQCVNKCSNHIWPTNGALKLNVDPITNCVIDPLPQCPGCHALARPNVVMFSDWTYIGDRQQEQIAHYELFKNNLVESKANLVIIELGAGTAIPTVRWESEHMFTDSRWTAHLIRINPVAEHAEIKQHHKKKSRGQAVELILDALTGLKLIDAAIKKKL